jgi:hypothetical protein
VIGLAVTAVGWLLILVAVVLLWGPIALAVSGVVTLLVGLFADLDSLRSPKRA